MAARSHTPAVDRFALDSLVVGAANRRAIAAACAVAEAPGTHNPLFIHGSPGLGKTHLLRGIAMLARKLNADRGVELVTLHEFLEQHRAAVTAGNLDAWDARWKKVQVLLIDDIQFVAGRADGQAELARLFTIMQERGVQLVITSDRGPAEIDALDANLLTRFTSGLVVGIESPDADLRAAIVRRAAIERGIGAHDAVIGDLAAVGYSSVRELHGAVNRALAERAIVGREPRVEDVANAVGLDAPPLTPRRATKEFQDYLAGVAGEAPQDVDAAKARLAEAIAHWAADGYSAGPLERALAQPAPGAAGELIETFARDVERLRSLEAQMAAIDPVRARDEVFHDPDRIAQAADLVSQARAGVLPAPAPLGMYVRALFDVSTSNRVATLAADVVAEQPGTRFSPLLIHGMPASGKTHLAHATGNAILARHSGLSVACVSAAQFNAELKAAGDAAGLERWRARYGCSEVLIIDDVHLLASDERAQDELVALIDAMQSAGRQLIITSAQPPHALRDIRPRLRSRLGGGLVVHLQTPDRVLRSRVATRLLVHAGQRAEPELVQVLADQPVVSLRELEAIVHRLIAAAVTRDVSLTAALARGELGVAPRATPVLPTFQVADPAFLDREKIVWHWPEPEALLIEDIR